MDWFPPILYGGYIMSVYSEIEIKTDVNKLYKDLSKKNGILLDTFLCSYLRQFEVKPEFDKDTYTDEQLIIALEGVIQKVIE